MTALRIYNTLGRRLETFEPVHPGEARVYSCGPTVYNYVHIGNLRTFVFVDVLRRSLEYLGYRVNLVMNITDVDDKIIAAAGESGRSLAAYTEPFTEAFFGDLETLHAQSAHRYPRATEHLGEMVEMIEALVERGFAYEVDGSVFFRIASDEEYGKLSGRDLDQARRGERVLADDYEKEDVRDFVLWKAAKPGEPSWESPWGPGRPGWHIECSAMSLKYLGQPFDIHTGGVDLVFPHHENEVAQAECATGEAFARTWVHAEHLIVDGQKMSKSLGNQYTLRELIEKGADPRAVRYLFVSVQYRQKLNFTFESLEAAAAALRRVDEMRYRLDLADESGPGDPAVVELAEGLKSAFAEALADDLNLPAGLGALFTFVREVNKRLEQGALGEGDRERLLHAVAEVDRVLGVLDPEEWKGSDEASEDDAEIDRLVRERDEARKNRDFASSDRLRDELTARGIVLEDTPQGSRWRRK